MRLPDAFHQAARALQTLSGVGERTAQRYVFHLLDHPDHSRTIARALAELPERIGRCRACGHLAEASAGDGLCPICADPHRDASLLCVVESVPHLLAIERSGTFRGRYHVLHGALSPVRGIGPDELRIPALVERVRTDEIGETIVATDVDTEGEATAAYIADLLSDLDVKVTRIATGVPMGGDLEYLDSTTVARALDGRR